MKLQTRRRIFYVFILLFVVIGAAVVLYAEGWRLDLSTLQAEKAGGVYVRSYPSSATITLGGKPIQNQSAFLSSGTFISGLLPKTYTLKLSAPGYDAWIEAVPVTPTLVTEMKYAVLVPASSTAITTSSPVSDYFQADGGVVTESGGAITWLGKTIGHGTIISHSTDLKTAVIRSVNAKTGAASYSLYNFTNNTSTPLSAALAGAGIRLTATTNLFIDPYDDTAVFAQTAARIVRIDAGTLRATTVTTAPAGETIETPIAVSPSVMAWALFSAPSPSTGTTGSSRIVVYDKFSGNTVDSSLTVPGAVKQLAWVRNNALGVLENTNALYLYNVSAEHLSVLADDVKQFYPAADGNAVAALEYDSLEIFSFVSGQPSYYRFTLPETANVQGLAWYKDDAHLFVEYQNHVSFLDLADTALKNLTTISDGTDASYDAQENSLYIIDPAQELIRFDFPQ
ncbi:MAG TPA: hypothetical protein VMA75_03270 [Candidatus Paceibacterota bacterium]|nr:hypothetical protein [Candidatus Paceibacterota bacterium]